MNGGFEKERAFRKSAGRSGFSVCQAIVNYDLPYNPMRVEQRIGRMIVSASRLIR